METMKEALLNWDTTSAEDISAIYERYEKAPDFLSEISGLMVEPGCERGATWLLKHYGESGRKIDDARRIYQSLPKLRHWEAKLHVLQSMSYLTIAGEEKKIVETFVRECLGDGHAFVRAWAYNGFSLLALQYPEYAQEVEELLKRGEKEEAASVRARIRNIKKERRQKTL